MKINHKDLSVSLSKKSFHYKFLEFIIGKTPASEFNSLCPYFWTVIFCLIISPIVAPVKAFILLRKTVLTYFDNKVWIPRFEKWIKSLDDIQLYSLYSGFGKYSLRIPYVFNRILRENIEDSELFKFYYLDLVNITETEFMNRIKAGSLKDFQDFQKRKDERLQRKLKKQLFRDKYFGWTDFFINPIKGISKAKLISFTKKTFYTILLIGLCAIIYLFVRWILSLDLVFSWKEFLNFIIRGIVGIVCITLVLFLVVYIAYCIDEYQIFNSKPVVAIKKAIKKFFKALASPFVFVWKYFMITKDKYCPEIKWDDEQ